LPVYLSEDGERIGVVKGATRDASGEIVSYQIDCQGTSVEVPSTHLIMQDEGVIIEPLWYIEADKFIRELEIEMMKIPDAELIMASADRSGVSRGTILKMISSRKDISPYIEKGSIVQKALLDRLQMLEEDRGKVTQDIITLEQKRIFDEIDRREFISGLIDLRKRRVLNEANIEKCRSLLSRLNRLPFIPSEVDMDLLSSSFRGSGSMVSQTKVGEIMNPDVSQDKVKKIRKVRVLKVEKELDDLKKRMDARGPAMSGDMEEKIRLGVSMEMKKEKMKEINEDIRMLDKVLAAPDVTGGIKEYLAEKRATLEVQKKKLSEEVRSGNKKIEGLSAKASQAPRPEKGIKEVERSEEEVKPMRDGGVLQVGLVRKGLPCVMCGDLLASGLKQCPSCGARTLKGVEAKKNQIGGAVLSDKTGLIMVIVGAGVILGAIIALLLL
jgi:hypothetical protein